MSMPTGEENFALLDAFNQGYQGGIQGGSSSSVGSRAQHNIVKRGYGRGSGGRRIGAGSQGARASRQQRSSGQAQSKQQRGQAYRRKDGGSSAKGTTADPKFADEADSEEDVSASLSNDGQAAALVPAEKHIEGNDA